VNQPHGIANETGRGGGECSYYPDIFVKEYNYLQTSLLKCNTFWYFWHISNFFIQCSKSDSPKWIPPP